MRRTLASVALVLLAIGVVVAANPAVSRTGYKLNPALRAAIAAEQGKAPPRLPNGNFVAMPSGALVHSAMEGLGLHPAGPTAPAAAAAASLLPTTSTAGCSNVFSAPGFPDNVRANQDCGFRFQSEEWVAINPTDPNNVVVSQNDSSLSGNHTGVDYSLDGGAHFGDSRLPSGRIIIPEAPGGLWSFDFFSDPAHAFNSRGDLFYTTLGADFAQDGFGGLFVWASDRCFKGSVLHTPGSGSCAPGDPPLSATAVPVRTNFDNPNRLDDKELMAADAWPTSPFRDNLYITWTIFDFECGGSGQGFCDAPIFFSRSTDGGQSWSPALEISGENPALCNFGNFFDPSQPADACNNNQFSDPVVGPDGTLYVFFMNYNTDRNTETSPGGLHNQILMVKSSNGGTTWSSPVKVADDFGTEPYSLPGHEIPDCDLFRQCLPPNGYRLGDYPTAAIDSTGKLSVFWQDFRDGGPCATDTDPGLTGLPVTPCANYNADIFVTSSNDGGATWLKPASLSIGGTAAQWQPWAGAGSNGVFYVAFYDREYGDCESTGCNDISLFTRDRTGHVVQRITTSSMPNLTCGENPFQCGFLGDYMSLAVGGGKVAIVWGDTRQRTGTVPEEDVYYASLPSSGAGPPG
jgi:hypothetical protein